MNRGKINPRLKVRVAGGKSMPAITGKETDAELREIVVKFLEKRPTRAAAHDSTLRVLNNFYHGSLKSMTSSMTRMALLSLFEMEQKPEQQQAHLDRNRPGKIQASKTGPQDAHLVSQGRAELMA